MPLIRDLSPTLDGAAVDLGTSGVRSLVIPSGAYATPLWVRDGGSVVHRVDSLPWKGTLVGDGIEVLSADPAAAVQITTTTLPGGTDGVFYSEALQATGGDGTYSWSVVSGSLPTGVNLSGGVISGTPSATGTFNFTVECDDGIQDPVTQALSIEISAAAAAWFEETWDYSDASDLLAQSHIVDSSSAHPGELNLITGIADQPGGGTRALECRWRGDISTGIDHTVGVTVTLPDAAVDQPREAWFRIPIWFSSNFSTAGPLLGDPSAPDAGGKLFFIFDQTELSNARWEVFYGLFGDRRFQLDFSGNKGTGELAGPFRGDTDTYLFNGGWHVIDLHLDMDADVWEMTVDGHMYRLGTGVSTDPGVGRYISKIALARNINSGAVGDMAIRFGEWEVHTTDPGWDFYPELVQSMLPDLYPDTAGFFADPLITDATGSGPAGEVNLVTAPSVSPGGMRRCIEATYYDFATVGNEVQAGFNIAVQDHAARALREIWWDGEVLFDAHWITNGPGAGNADHKFQFWFTQNEVGSQRVEHHVGHFGSGFGHFVNGVGDTQGDATQVWDGTWQRYRGHLKLGTDPAGGGSAEWVMQWIDIGLYTRTWIGGIDITWASDWLAKCAVFRNVNKGFTVESKVRHGRWRLFNADPWGGAI